MSDRRISGILLFKNRRSLFCDYFKKVSNGFLKDFLKKESVLFTKKKIKKITTIITIKVCPENICQIIKTAILIFMSFFTSLTII